MNKWLIGLVVLVAGVVVGWYVLRGIGNVPTQQAPAPADNGAAKTDVGTPQQAASGEAQQKGVKEQTTVTYADSGFTPNSVTVKKGTTVTFVNESTGNMWVASAVHPTHQLLPGFDQLKSVANGGTYEYTFDKVGTWKYHNHVSAGDTGTVIVTE